MILSKACNYGIRAALYVALQNQTEYVSIKEISQKLEISFHFLTKILQTLTQNKIMSSFRGPHGGVTLAKPADEIKVLEIIHAIDGNTLFENCVLGLNDCGDENPCPLHNQWKEIRDSIYNLFHDTSLGQLTDDILQRGFRLTNISV